MTKLLEPGKAAASVELAEYAIEQIEISLEQIDDSNGMVGDTIHRLAELRLQFRPKRNFIKLLDELARRAVN